MNRVVVIGLADAVTVGSDEVGPAVIRALGRRDLTGADLVIFAGDASRLCDRWSHSELVVLIDEGRMAWSPRARVRRRSLRHPSMAANLAPSRHAQLVRDAMALGMATERLPPTLLLYSVDTPEGDVPEAAAVSSLAAEIAAELADHARRRDQLVAHGTGGSRAKRYFGTDHRPAAQARLLS